jgi:hypothetical protein
VNIGVGYYSYHSLDCYVKLSELFANLVRFVKFYHRFKDVRFEHEPFVETRQRKAASSQPSLFERCYGFEGGVAFRDPFGDERLSDGFGSAFDFVPIGSPEDYAHCEGCGTLYGEDELTDYNGKIYCRDCFQVCIEERVML